jgi:hypothetical protein
MAENAATEPGNIVEIDTATLARPRAGAVGRT